MYAVADAAHFSDLLPIDGDSQVRAFIVRGLDDEEAVFLRRSGKARLGIGTVSGQGRRKSRKACRPRKKGG